MVWRAMDQNEGAETPKTSTVAQASEMTCPILGHSSQIPEWVMVH